jgi:putative membrane protein
MPARLWILAAVVAAALGWFPLTDLLYVLIAAHALVLILGGAYTYARVPLGFWFQDLFQLDRNPYDKIGHFMQGLVPVLSVCVALAVSSVYELIEWGAALALGQGAEEFLGTQGDAWDTQSDMFLALLGAVAALVCFARMHDRQIGAVRRVVESAA